MGHQHLPFDTRPNNNTWTRTCCTAVSAIVVATACGAVLSGFTRQLDGHSFRGRNQHLTKLLIDDNGGGAVGAVTGDSDGTGALRTTRGMQALGMEQSSGGDTSGNYLTQHYASFAEYALESTTTSGLSSVPVPVVKLAGQESALSIPIITIIGAEKAGTTSLRGNLMTHPMLDGIRAEVPFFDQPPTGYPEATEWQGDVASYRYPEVGQWEGDGLEQDIGILSAGKILREYAKTCAKKGRSGPTHSAQVFQTAGLHVDCSPQYIFHPLAPYRINMVRPGGKFLVILRDPTDRYFSHLRMEMCRSRRHRNLMPKALLYSIFHPPGGAKGYLAAAEEDYEPYTAVCRGENASSSDLWECHQALEVKNPLYRGLYADQLERWFRVFDRSQIMVIDGEEMYADFTGVLTAVAEFAGLPEHRFVYDPRREHKNEGCAEQDHLEGNDYFVEGGRYDTMIEEEEIILSGIGRTTSASTGFSTATPCGSRLLSHVEELATLPSYTHLG